MLAGPQAHPYPPLWESESKQAVAQQLFLMPLAGRRERADPETAPAPDLGTNRRSKKKPPRINGTAGIKMPRNDLGE